MSAADDARAARRFAIISAVRLVGVAAFLAGIAVLADALDWPAVIGVLLVIAGAFGTFLAPVLLARQWSTNPRR